MKNSIAAAWQPKSHTGSVQSAAKWPAINKEQRETIVRLGGLADMRELSSILFEDNRAHTEEILEQLFPGNPLLCCGKSSRVFETRPRAGWRGELSRLALIVPSPMIASRGLTQEAKESAHALSNTGARRFLICEFDTGTLDEQAAILIHLGGYAPLVCAVYSGNKSLHGWFYVWGHPEAKVIKFFRYAVSLGADSRLWSRSQFCRMPDGTRDNGRRQTVFFVNFKPVEERT